MRRKRTVTKTIFTLLGAFLLFEIPFFTMTTITNLAMCHDNVGIIEQYGVGVLIQLMFLSYLPANLDSLCNFFIYFACYTPFRRKARQFFRLRVREAPTLSSRGGLGGVGVVGGGTGGGTGGCGGHGAVIGVVASNLGAADAGNILVDVEQNGVDIGLISDPAAATTSSTTAISVLVAADAGGLASSSGTGHHRCEVVDNCCAREFNDDDDDVDEDDDTDDLVSGVAACGPRELCRILESEASSNDCSPEHRFYCRRSVPPNQESTTQITLT